MSAAAVVYFLFAMIAGQNAASLTTLGQFHDMASCKAAAVAVNAAMQAGESMAREFCVSSIDLGAISEAAHAQ